MAANAVHTRVTQAGEAQWRTVRGGSCAMATQNGDEWHHWAGMIAAGGPWSHSSPATFGRPCHYAYLDFIFGVPPFLPDEGFLQTLSGLTVELCLFAIYICLDSVHMDQNILHIVSPNREAKRDWRSGAGGPTWST
ncbi:hypothetical protein N7532_002852 [Penicillium argentinense]|uniref:Uncharacterized protein n=1 Tax=Penicillium argentinense TaxID=1131581 RepID=A0A9W9KLW0_9EURO|nr:uncharacterized protein N7532_002852 [Penicillium argentinense]KAJ5110207.1 hypothetical protein N7532_002852 [Penicillium argentinense]